MPEHPDIVRLRNEYADRARHVDKTNLYSPFNPPQLFGIQQRQQAVLKILKLHGITDLSNINILEIGCGSGRIMVEYLGFGASPKNLHGVDLLFNRLQDARQCLPGSNFINADGQSLPFSTGTFDLILQYTAISSILDPDVRRNVCADMLRALKPDGVILSYDFWLNPTNQQTRGLRPLEIRDAFAGCSIEYNKITLAPPLARKLVPLSWGLAYFFEKLRLFNTHYLAVIRPHEN